MKIRFHIVILAGEPQVIGNRTSGYRRFTKRRIRRFPYSRLCLIGYLLRCPQMVWVDVMQCAIPHYRCRLAINVDVFHLCVAQCICFCNELAAWVVMVVGGAVAAFLNTFSASIVGVGMGGNGAARDTDVF